MSKLIEKAIYRRLSSAHSGGHAKTDAAMGAFEGRGETADVDGPTRKNSEQ